LHTRDTERIKSCNPLYAPVKRVEAENRLARTWNRTERSGVEHSHRIAPLCFCINPVQFSRALYWFRCRQGGVNEISFLTSSTAPSRWWACTLLPVCNGSIIGNDLAEYISLRS